MGEYCEEEGSIRRHYISSKIQTFQTQRAKVDIISNIMFGDMLFLDNQLQLATRDEYIYHEMLVHMGMSYVQTPKKVCILGGADGCAVREVLKWPGVEQIDLYDYDEELVGKFRGDLSSWNSRSLHDPRVRIYYEDVRNLVEKEKAYDFIIMDLTDPSSWSVGEGNLWSSVLPLLKRWLNPGGSLVMNAGGILPWDSNSVEYGLHKIADTFTGSDLWLHVVKTFVPSFSGEWCFFILHPEVQERKSLEPLKGKLRFYSENVVLRSALWTKDFSGVIPRRGVNLKNYLPLIPSSEDV